MNFFGEEPVNTDLARSIRPVFLPWCIFLISMLLVAAEFVHLGIYAAFDFRCFYAAGYLARTEPSRLYDIAQQERTQNLLVPSPKGVLVFYRPSYEALIYAPFSLLKYRTAYFMFVVFNALLVLAALVTAGPMLFPDLPWLKSRPGPAFFLFIPLLLTVVQGQDSILFLLLCCVTWRQLQSGKILSAGCILALALFKFQIAIPIAILIAIRRGWRFAVGFLVTSVGLALFCIGIVSRAGTISMLQLISSAASSAGKSTLAQRVMTIYPLAMPNLEGLLYACGARLLSPLAALAVVSICSLFLFAVCAGRIRRCKQSVALSIAILCALMVSYHLYIHEVTLSLLPTALLTGRAHRFIVVVLFALPIFLVPFGTNSYFLLAVPLLAMLINAIRLARKPIMLAHDAPEVASA